VRGRAAAGRYRQEVQIGCGRHEQRRRLHTLPAETRQNSRHLLAAELRSISVAIEGFLTLPQFPEALPINKN